MSGYPTVSSTGLAVSADALQTCSTPEDPAQPPASSACRQRLQQRFDAVRAATLALAAPLSAEDQQAQSMPLASPTKWHLAHTAWFFDAMLLAPRAAGVADERWQRLFNSYYNSLGGGQAREHRGLMTRPSLDQVLAYRVRVDEGVRALIGRTGSAEWAELAAMLELGLQHEQQHQELILMDIKHLLACHPDGPAYRRERPPQTPAPASVSPPAGGGERAASAASRKALAASIARAGAGDPATAQDAADAARGGWLEVDGGLYWIGAEDAGFAYDNERPRHRVWLQPFRLRDRLVTCGEWLEFIADGGYRRPELWLSDGWAVRQQQGWTCPLYWRPRAADDQGGADAGQACSSDARDWSVFTLSGIQPLAAEEPVAHLSYYEADAYARWTGARLPTEAEWEVAAVSASWPADTFALHPPGVASGAGLQQMAGALWQWTASAYAPYPGFRPLPGAAGEYNGKFMSGQMVLRGGACITPPGHARPSYRNFYPPDARWAFSGLRLAADA